MFSGTAPSLPSSSSPPSVSLSVLSSLFSCSSAVLGPRGLVSVSEPDVPGKRLMVRLHPCPYRLQTSTEARGQPEAWSRPYRDTSELVYYNVAPLHKVLTGPAIRFSPISSRSSSVPALTVLQPPSAVVTPPSEMLCAVKDETRACTIYCTGN